MFQTYLNKFIKDCAHTGNTEKILVPVLARLLTNYKHAHYKFTHSPLRLEWRENSKYFVIPNPSDDFNVSKTQKYTRQAYNFFYKVSSVQLYFIKKIIGEVSNIVRTNDTGIGDNHGNISIVETEAEIQTPETKFIFVILPTASGKTPQHPSLHS